MPIGPIGLPVVGVLPWQPLLTSKSYSCDSDNTSSSPAPWASTWRPPSGANSTNGLSGRITDTPQAGSAFPPRGDCPFRRGDRPVAGRVDCPPGRTYGHD